LLFEDLSLSAVSLLVPLWDSSLVWPLVLGVREFMKLRGIC
jgi:hypothetical protein